MTGEPATETSNRRFGGRGSPLALSLKKECRRRKEENGGGKAKHGGGLERRHSVRRRRPHLRIQFLTILFIKGYRFLCNSELFVAQQPQITESSRKAKVGGKIRFKIKIRLVIQMIGLPDQFSKKREGSAVNPYGRKGGGQT